MGKQIAEAEGEKPGGDEAEEDEAEGDDQEVSSHILVLCWVEADLQYAPTTLPSHLLALLTVPSPRAIIIVMEEFDLFTEHARQALLYCLRELPPADWRSRPDFS
jgi:origin recognition complex subunit 4